MGSRMPVGHKRALKVRYKRCKPFAYLQYLDFFFFFKARTFGLILYFMLDLRHLNLFPRALLIFAIEIHADILPNIFAIYFL